MQPLHKNVAVTLYSRYIQDKCSRYIEYKEDDKIEC